MYTPGSDVSPYAYTISAISAIRFFGLTLSAFASLALLFYLALSVLFRRKLPTKDAMTPFLLALLPNLIVFFWTPSVSNSIDSFAKMMTPFAIMLYFTIVVDASRVNVIKKTVEFINILMVLQVIVCKLSYGFTSAYNYYYELEEEFFGYYNHPHSYTSLLWILALYNIYAISRKEHYLLNIILFVTNVSFTYFTGVRTYLVALLGGLAYIGIISFMDNHGKRLRGFVIVGVALMLVFGSRLIENFGAGRTYITFNASSGRLLRWGLDLNYFFTQYSLPQLLFGRGVDSSYIVNKEILGVYINSLNLFIDLLLDYGVIGLVLIVSAYFILFKQCISDSNKLFLIGVMASFFIASMINSAVSYVPTMTMLVAVIWIMKVDSPVNMQDRNNYFGLNRFRYIRG